MKFATIVAVTSVLTIVSAAPFFSQEENLEARGAQISSTKQYGKETKNAHKLQDAAKKYHKELDKIEASNKSAQEKFVAKNRAGREYEKAVKQYGRDFDEDSLERRGAQISSTKQYGKETKNAHKLQDAAKKYHKELDKIEASNKSAQEKFVAKNRAGREYEKAVKQYGRDFNEDSLERRGAQISSTKQYGKETKNAHKLQDAAKKYHKELDKIEASNKSAQEKFTAKNRAGREYEKAVKQYGRDLDEEYLEIRDLLDFDLDLD